MNNKNNKDNKDNKDNKKDTDAGVFFCLNKNCRNKKC